MGRIRASFGVLIGGAAVAAGLILRGAAFIDQPLFLDGTLLVWGSLALALASVLAAWLARPADNAWLNWGLAPVAGAIGLGLPAWSLFSGEDGIEGLAGGLEAAGGFALVVSLLRFYAAQAAREVVPVRLPDKKKVRLVREDDEEDKKKKKKRPEVPVASLEVGDRFEVKAGADLPVDGVVVSGGGFVDESALLGPVLPTAKAVGDPVFAGTSSSAPELVVEVARPPDAALIAQREARVAQVAVSLAKAGKGAFAGGAVITLLALGAGAAPVVVQETGRSVSEWLSIWAAIALAVGVGAPWLAGLRARLAALGALRDHGVMVSRDKDVLALMAAHRWRIDPLLLAAPGAVEAVALADTPKETLLQVAEALLSEHHGPDQQSVRDKLDAENLERLAPAAVKAEDGVYRGTVNGRRWFLGREGALEDQVELEPGMDAPLSFLRDRGQAVLLIGRDDDEGVLGAIGIGTAVRPEAAQAARDLGASVLPGLPDATREALARAAEIEADGPPLGKRDASLLSPHAALPSDGARIRVLEPQAKLRLPDAAAPRALVGALSKIGPGLNRLPELARAARTRAASTFLVPPVVAGGLAWMGWFSPGVGALIGMVAIVVAGRHYGAPPEPAADAEG